MNTGRLLILVGVSGSGKSTFAHEVWADAPNITTIVNRDKIRELLFGFTEEGIAKYYTRNDLRDREKQVTRYEDTLINEGLTKGHLVIVDATHLSRKYIERFKYWNVPTELKIFDTPLPVAKVRVLDRNRRVDESIVEKQYNSFKGLVKSLEKEPIDFTIAEPVNKSLQDIKPKPHAYIFDIDGTLAHMRDRSPYDWKRVGEDMTDIPTVAISRMIHNFLKEYTTDSKVIICTGRDGVSLEDTEKWLKDNFIYYDEIYIREKGDSRADWIVKEEMWRDIAEDYYIMGMFDDRLQVVRRARALGLKVFNVEYHNF